VVVQGSRRAGVNLAIAIGPSLRMPLKPARGENRRFTR
jgi:hypothetical protein